MSSVIAISKENLMLQTMKKTLKSIFNHNEVQDQDKSTDMLLNQLANEHEDTVVPRFKHNDFKASCVMFVVIFHSKHSKNYKSTIRVQHIKGNRSLLAKCPIFHTKKVFRKNEEVALPTLNKLMHYQGQVHNEIPVFPKTPNHLKNDKEDKVEGFSPFTLQIVLSLFEEYQVILKFNDPIVFIKETCFDLSAKVKWNKLADSEMLVSRIIEHLKGFIQHSVNQFQNRLNEIPI
ncbi:hypothetical protein EDC96DRAFT_595208 [Choanephora cucurbitarum]|nr:hypothetical protein EDC96DRAFT_595208 [Choanephora cucurbitarum]